MVENESLEALIKRLDKDYRVIVEPFDWWEWPRLRDVLRDRQARIEELEKQLGKVNHLAYAVAYNTIVGPDGPDHKQHFAENIEEMSRLDGK